MSRKDLPKISLNGKMKFHWYVFFFSYSEKRLQFYFLKIEEMNRGYILLGFDKRVTFLFELVSGHCCACLLLHSMHVQLGNYYPRSPVQII